MTGPIYRGEVAPDWIDYNGHMQDAYYALAFSNASDAFLASIGIDAAYRARTRSTVYLVECHTFYLAELRLGAAFEIEARVLDVDAKRFLVHMTMTSGGQVRATNERMELHVNQTPTPRAAPLPGDIHAALMALKRDAGDVAALSHRSRAMGFRR